MTFKLKRFSPINNCCLGWRHSGDDMMLPEIELFFIHIVYIHTYILLQWKCSVLRIWKLNTYSCFFRQLAWCVFFFLLKKNKYLMAWYIYGFNNSLWNVHKFSGQQCFIGKQKKTIINCSAIVNMAQFGSHCRIYEIWQHFFEVMVFF